MPSSWNSKWICIHKPPRFINRGHSSSLRNSTQRDYNSTNEVGWVYHVDEGPQLTLWDVSWPATPMMITRTQPRVRNNANLLTTITSILSRRACGCLEIVSGVLEVSTSLVSQIGTVGSLIQPSRMRYIPHYTYGRPMDRSQHTAYWVNVVSVASKKKNTKARQVEWDPIIDLHSNK